jgi:SAM-dependent methyltransferase
MSSSCCGGSPKESVSIKNAVKEKYGQFAKAASEGRETSCACSGTNKDAITCDLYAEAETAGLPIEAILASAGCANPTALAELKPGEIVLDLGSGGGIDVLISAKRVGPTGKAYGLDMTDEMLELARKNQKEAGVENVQFLKGEIENIPLPSNSVDVIISNCVINLSTNKDQVIREAFRVLKPGGRFAVADIVLTKSIPELLQKDFALWTGCISGALLIDDYKSKLIAAGFIDVEIEIVRTYSESDKDGLVSNDLRIRIGDDGVNELMSSFVSAFVRAVKPNKSKCCCGCG